MPESPNKPSENPGTIPYLPEYKGTQLNPPRFPGQWEHHKNLLGVLGQDLDVRGSLDWSVLTAIPTIFARPLLFAEALLDKDHPLHQQVVREWRGLLSVICFEQYQLFDIKLEPINLDLFINQGKGNADQFVQALNTLMPQPVKDWKNLTTIRVGDVMLGATSPKSLVYASADYRCPLSVPWVDEKTGRLNDPVEALVENDSYAETMSVLKAWIASLLGQIRNTTLPALDSVHHRRLVELLEEWHGAIHFDEAQGLEFMASKFSSAPYNLIPGAVKDKRGVISDFLLQPTREGAERPILVTEEGWKQVTLRVFGDITPEQVKYPSEASGTVLDNGRIKYKWIRPDLSFFTDKLLKMRTSEKTAVLYNNDGYVPPLRREVLDYFNPDDLADVFLWEQAAGGGVQVSLSLRTTAGHTIKVSKTYSLDNVVEVKPPPFLEIWPNFRAANWKHYFCVYSQVYVKQFNCHPYPLQSTAPTASRQDSKVWKMETLPEAMVCSWDDQPVGLVPIRQPALLPDATNAWRAAVDFGTSNTSVFYQVTVGEKPKKLKFDDRSMQVTDVAARPRNLFLYSSFFPPAAIDGMFPSHLRILDDRGTPIPEPALDGVILFVEPLQWTSILEEKGAESVKENMKWSEDERVRKYIATFNKQLMLMIAAEARARGVKSIEARFSYPSAFSKKMLNQLRQQWGAIVAEANEKLNLSITVKQTANRLAGETESAAACKYLLHERDAPIHALECPQISMDIGGGTTDIAIWLGGKLAVQCSLLLGGRELALFAQKNKDFRDNLVQLAQREVSDAVFIEHPDAVLNILMRLSGKDIASALAMGKGIVPCFKRTRTMAFLIFAGSFYYTGQLLRYLVSKGNKIDSCDIYLGGNGSRLISWISDSGTTVEALRQILQKALAPDITLGNIEVHDVKDPKEEVARGLLYDYGASETIAEPVAILGEEGYVFDGTKKEWYDDIYGQLALMDLSRLKVPDAFPQLTKFLTEFNSQAEDLTLDVLNSSFVPPQKIKARIQQAIDKIRYHGDEALVQPFFIEAVRQLLTRLHEEPLRS
jgi:hypothetical protein